MSKLNDIRNKFTSLQIGEDIYKLKFDMNAFAELEEMYGSINVAMEALSDGSVKAIRNVLFAGLVSQHSGLTVKDVGALIDLRNVEVISEALQDALSSSLPEVEEAEEKSNKKVSAEKK